MAIYRGVSSVAREVKSIYRGISAVARQVKAGYRGVSSVARQFYTLAPTSLNILTEFTSANWTRKGGTSLSVSTSQIRLVNNRTGGECTATSSTFDITNLKTLSYSLGCYNSDIAPDVTWDYGSLFLFHSNGSYLQIGSTLGNGTVDVSKLTGNAYFKIVCNNTWWGEDGVDWKACDLIIKKLQFS